MLASSAVGVMKSSLNVKNSRRSRASLAVREWQLAVTRFPPKATIALIGYGFSVRMFLDPDSTGNITVFSKPYLIVKGPGLPVNGKVVRFTWIGWNPTGSTTTTNDGYTFLKTAQKETLVVPVRPNKYKIEFTAGYHMSQKNAADPGNDITTSFCYVGPIFIPAKVVIKKKKLDKNG